MERRKRAVRKSGATRSGGRPSTFLPITGGLCELRIGARVVLDVLVTMDGELFAFVRVDGALWGALPVAGQA